jgi:DnaK suppressor protein
VDHKVANFDPTYIDRQRARLQSLRAELIAAADGKASEQAALGAESAGEAHEHEDDAQRLTTLELDSNLVAHDQQRLVLVDRALQKIEDGTYGLSDASGDAIPRERLEVMPEAIYTVAEQDSRER